MELVINKKNLTSKFPCFGAAPDGVLKGSESPEDRIMKEYEKIEIENREKLRKYFDDDLKLFDYFWNFTDNKIGWKN